MSENTENSKEELESSIEKLKNSINQLEETNVELKSRVSELETENSSLTNETKNIVNLQKRNAELEAENKKYLDELNQLKQKLASSGPSGKLNVPVKTKPTAKKGGPQQSKVWRDDKTVVVPSGRVKDLINKRNAAMASKGGSKKTEIKKEEQEPLPAEAPIKETPEIASEKEVKKVGLGSAQGRRKCPKCGNSSKAHIREMTDKTKIISAYPRMYGKKYKCGECGSEWR